MKTNKITLYFFLVTLTVSLILCSFFYFFTKEKDSALKETIQSYRENSSKLIADRVYEDLLIDNLLEAQRKLNLLKESKIIDDYQIIKKSDMPKNELKYCETIFFDKNFKTVPWGKVCTSFPASLKENALINLRRVSLVFIFLMAFTVFLIIFLFKKITKINRELYEGIGLVLNKENRYQAEDSFWAPVLSELEKLAILNQRAEEKLFDQKIESEKIEMANQVAHDIRSPLAALENIDLSKLPDSIESKLAKDAIKRLKGIAKVLLEKGKIKQSEDLSDINLYSLITNIIDAKTVEFPSRKINRNFTDTQSFAHVDEIKLESILSNFITNAVEASGQNSVITVTSENNQQNCFITISDQGKGIPSDILQKLGKEKITFGKNNGNGLGVFDAIQSINSWNGTVDIYSQLNIGTSIRISLPILSKNNPMNILIDNDELVCITWERKAMKSGVKLKTYRSTLEVISDENQFPVDTIFYIDSELDNEKGEDFAQKLYNMGYVNLIMCSGYSKDKFQHFPFIKKVIGKLPPF